MIEIHYSEMVAPVDKWKEKLDELIVQYSLKKSSQVKTPYIKEGKKNYKDIKSITQFLEDLEKDINDWRTPSCGV